MSERATPPERRHVTVLGESGCPLCARVGELLRELAPELGVRVHEIDIAAEPALWERYRYAAPVICANGVPLLSGRIEEVELRAELERAFGPDAALEIPREESLFLDAFECPICEGPLEARPRAVACLRCGHEYERRDGVLLLLDESEPSGATGLLDRLGAAISFRLER